MKMSPISIALKLSEVGSLWGRGHKEKGLVKSSYWTWVSGAATRTRLPSHCLYTAILVNTLYVHVCMCVFIYVFIGIYMCACVYECMYMWVCMCIFWMYARVCTCIYACVCAYLHRCMHVAWLHVQECVHASVHGCVHTSVCWYVFPHTSPCVYSWTSSWTWYYVELKRQVGAIFVKNFMY